MTKPLLISLFLLLSFQLAAQNNTEISNLKTGDYIDPSPQLNGLWVVQKVTVGEEVLTPVAKWFRFMDNGVQKSGNGWLQNYEGTWTLDAASNRLYNKDMDGIEDPYGPFTVSLSGNEMTWRRTEDGMQVVVSLTSATKVPLAPWDKIVGRWELIGITELDKDTNIEGITDLEPTIYQFRWDNAYNVFDSDGRRLEGGIWQINAHRPWLTLVPYGKNEMVGQEVTFKEGNMIFTKTRDNIVETYTFRKEQF